MMEILTKIKNIVAGVTAKEETSGYAEEKLPARSRKERKARKAELEKALKHKPPFGIYCRMICEAELIKIEGMQRQMKKAKKDYIKLQNEFKHCKTEGEVNDIVEHFPFFQQSYDLLDKELASIAAEDKLITQMVEDHKDDLDPDIKSKGSKNE